MTSPTGSTTLAWRRLALATRHPQFKEGVRDMGGVGLGMAAWGLVTGVAMVKSGLTIPLALLMTFTVYAGSAQLAALPMIAGGAPLWVIWATAACVNLRFVVFSAQWRPYLRHLPRQQRALFSYFCVDLTYVLFTRRFPRPARGEGQMHYLAGNVGANWLAWQVPSIAGILLADVVPTAWGLGFAGVLALLGLMYSLLTDRVTTAAMAVAGTAAVAAFSLPLRLNIMVAIAAGVCIGLLLDPRTDSAAASAVAKKEA